MFARSTISFAGNCCCLGGALLGTLMLIADCHAQSIAQLCQGIAARAEAAETIRIEFEFRQVHGEETLLQQQSSERHVVAVQGDDWLVRNVAQPNFQMKRDAALLTYTDLPGPKTQRSRQLAITAPQSLASVLEVMELARATRLGTIHTHKQVDYIRASASRAIQLASETIDGHSIAVLEWEVPKTDYDAAFLWISPALASAETGRLRLAVDPDLGYVIRRMEYRLPDGHVVFRRDSTDFRRVADDIYFPFRDQAMIETNGSPYREAYRVLAVTHFNNPLPNDAFTLKLPQGTRIHDARPGIPHTRFRLSDQTQLDLLNRVMAPSDSMKSSLSWRATIMWLQAVVLGSLLIYQGLRNWRFSATRT